MLVVFRLAVIFRFPPRPDLARAGSAAIPLPCSQLLRDAGAVCCRRLRVRCERRRFFFNSLSVACLSSFWPTVLFGGFLAFPTATRKCVCVCVCDSKVCVCVCVCQRFSVSWTPASSSHYSDGLALQLAPIFLFCRQLLLPPFSV